MPDDTDTGNTGDTGAAVEDSGKQADCQEKLSEFERLESEYRDAHDEYWEAAEDYAAHDKDLEKAFADWTKAKSDKDANEAAIVDANKRIVEIDARIAEIDAIDPQAEIDKRMPSAMGDSTEYYDPGRNEPWTSIDYYLGLLEERGELVEERGTKQGEIEEAEGKREELDLAIVEASETKNTLVGETAPLQTAKIQAYEKAEVAFKDWHGLWARYVDYGCSELTGELDEPERLPNYDQAE